MKVKRVRMKTKMRMKKKKRMKTKIIILMVSMIMTEQILSKKSTSTIWWLPRNNKN